MSFPLYISIRLRPGRLPTLHVGIYIPLLRWHLGARKPARRRR